MAEFVLDFLWCVMCERDIFGVDPEQEQKGILISVGSTKRRETIFFTQKHTHHVFVVRLHTHLNTRAERERERGDDDADDDGAYYYYYFDAFR